MGGRWNRPGTRVIYAASTLALATLEFLVHLRRDRAPSAVVAHHADVPGDAPIDTLSDDRLPADWSAYPAPDALRDVGTRWASSSSSLLLSVPSTVLRVSPGLVPAERNYLINPAHDQFRRVRVGSVRLRLDPRLWS